MYSASPLDCAVHFCSCEHQLMGPPCYIVIHPVRDRLLSLSPAQSESWDMANGTVLLEPPQLSILYVIVFVLATLVHFLVQRPLANLLEEDEPYQPYAADPETPAPSRGRSTRRRARGGGRRPGG